MTPTAAAATTQCLLWYGDGCPAITDADFCQSSRDGRPWPNIGGRLINGQPCVWCGGQNCTANKDSLCEPLAWVSANWTAGAHPNWTVASCGAGVSLPVSALVTPLPERNATLEVFSTPGQPGTGQACRGETVTDAGRAAGDVPAAVPGQLAPNYYWTYTATSLEQCQAFCRTTAKCTGIEYNAGDRYCEIWWKPIQWTQAAAGYQCFRVQDPLESAEDDVMRGCLAYTAGGSDGGCGSVRDRDTCLASRDGHRMLNLMGLKVHGEPCVWCGGGPCTQPAAGGDAGGNASASPPGASRGAAPELCAPLDWLLHGQGVEFERLLVAEDDLTVASCTTTTAAPPAAPANASGAVAVVGRAAAVVPVGAAAGSAGGGASGGAAGGAAAGPEAAATAAAQREEDVGARSAGGNFLLLGVCALATCVLLTALYFLLYARLRGKGKKRRASRSVAVGTKMPSHSTEPAGLVEVHAEEEEEEECAPLVEGKGSTEAPAFVPNTSLLLPQVVFPSQLPSIPMPQLGMSSFLSGGSLGGNSYRYQALAHEDMHSQASHVAPALPRSFALPPPPQLPPCLAGPPPQWQHQQPRPLLSLTPPAGGTPSGSIAGRPPRAPPPVRVATPMASASTPGVESPTPRGAVQAVSGEPGADWSQQLGPPQHMVPTAATPPRSVSTPLARRAGGLLLYGSPGPLVAAAPLAQAEEPVQFGLEVTDLGHDGAIRRGEFGLAVKPSIQ